MVTEAASCAGSIPLLLVHLVLISDISGTCQSEPTKAMLQHYMSNMCTEITLIKPTQYGIIT